MRLSQKFVGWEISPERSRKALQEFAKGNRIKLSEEMDEILRFQDRSFERFDG